MIARRFQNKERGASLVEYAILLALIALLTIAGVKAVGLGVSKSFDKVDTEFTNAMS